MAVFIPKQKNVVQKKYFVLHATLSSQFLCSLLCVHHIHKLEYFPRTLSSVLPWLEAWFRITKSERCLIWQTIKLVDFKTLWFDTRFMFRLKRLCLRCKSLVKQMPWSFYSLRSRSKNVGAIFAFTWWAQLEGAQLLLFWIFPFSQAYKLDGWARSIIVHFFDFFWNNLTFMCSQKSLFFNNNFLDPG